MDPLTAVALATKAIAELVLEVIRGQPPELKARQWQWFIDWDVRMRKAFKLDDPNTPLPPKP